MIDTKNRLLQDIPKYYTKFKEKGWDELLADLKKVHDAERKMLENKWEQFVSETLDYPLRNDTVNTEQYTESVTSTALYEAIKVNETIVDVYLNDNDIGDEGCKALSEDIKVNQNIQRIYSIDANENSIGNEGCIELSEAPKVSRSIWNLGENKTGDEGLDSVTFTYDDHAGKKAENYPNVFSYEEPDLIVTKRDEIHDGNMAYFDVTFEGEGPSTVLEYIASIRDKWNETKQKINHFGIIEPSLSGKTRLIVELDKIQPIVLGMFFTFTNDSEIILSSEATV